MAHKCSRKDEVSVEDCHLSTNLDAVRAESVGKSSAQRIPDGMLSTL